MINFKENYHFSRFRRASNIFQGRGGVQLFQWGSNFFQVCVCVGGGGGGKGPIAYSL